MKYIQAILPLPLEGTFTYSVPQDLEDKIKVGMRVVVPCGQKKTYTALCVEVTDKKPDIGVKNIKCIYSVLDDMPMLLPQQLKLWQWMADYYMCPLGDIYKAALPAGLKAEDGYRPKTETYVGLTEKFHDEMALNIALDMVSRYEKQQKALAGYLELSHWAEISGTAISDDIKEITQTELCNVTHCTTPTVKSLVKRGILEIYQKEVGRLNTDGEFTPQNAKLLNEAQQEAYNQVLMQFMKKNVVLLHGVTSSGKTEIYIHLILKALQDHKQVLFLLPEIALTVQIMERLQRVFGSRLGIYHSKYSDAERVEIWKKQVSACPYDIIIGARSAALLPFKNLGLVIIDEEHETSYKQQDPAPRYHARSAAIMLASMYGAKTLLGSATPCMETYTNAKNGKFGYVRLDKRYKDIALPKIEVVDVKDMTRRKMMKGPFSPRLLEAIQESLDNNKQVILFQNRRGFVPIVECQDCGWIPKCEHCDVSLTMHKNINLLTCHYCGYTYAIPKVCPKCGGIHLRGRGFGTEKIEDQIMELFPEAKVARMDLDTTRTKNAYARIIEDFAYGKTNVLIGTQMITKGLDFDRVQLVGILDADSMLNYPDFRAYEHSYMMLQQVSGRAGRKGKQGLVILQTKSADLPVIEQVAANDSKTFYEDLDEERRLFNYPPYTRLIYVYLKHQHDNMVESAALMLGSILRGWFGERILGPDKPAVARVKSMCIRKIMIKLENGIDQKKVREYLRMAQKQILQDKQYAALQIFYDVDPQ
ncbi:MAG: primosomal protein N' [Prevotella sp.]|nr:primosomal protein N' [Prevotella sp.]MDY4150789.1 primosomal protein N' [Prevotella sp.]